MKTEIIRFDLMNVRLSKEQKVRIMNSDDVYSIMQQVLLRENKIRRNQEHFWVIGLNNAHKILFIELVSLGAVNRVAVDPPDVFRMAIYKLAVKMILVHNHPSGNLTPSKADEDFTDRLIKVGKLIKIQVIEHLIITEDNYTSLADNGTIQRLENSGTYEIVSKEKTQMKEFHERTLTEKAEKQKALVIARKMKEAGMDEKVIKQMTGLRLGEIRGL